MIYVIVDPRLENEIIYILVAVATAGGVPKLIKRGLKIAPPPRPKAPDIHPPTKEKMKSLIVFLLFMMMSHLANPILYFNFKAYWLLTFLKE